jgi:hypothetical protein
MVIGELGGLLVPVPGEDFLRRPSVQWGAGFPGWGGCPSKLEETSGVAQSLPGSLMLKACFLRVGWIQPAAANGVLKIQGVGFSSAVFHLCQAMGRIGGESLLPLGRETMGGSV